MYAYFLALIFLFCSGNAFAMLYDEPNTYTFNENEASLVREYSYYLSSSVDEYVNLVPVIKLIEPANNQKIALLFDKLTTVELQIILAACTITYMEKENFGNEYPRQDFRKAMGCKQFLHFLTWHNEKIHPLQTFLSNDFHEEPEINGIAWVLVRLSLNATNMNFILSICQKPEDIKNIFAQLQEIKPQNSNEVEPYPIEISGATDNERPAMYFGEAIRRLKNFLGDDLLTVQNHFREYFQLPQLENPTISLEDVLKFIEKNTYINRGLKLEKDPNNFLAPQHAKDDLFHIIKPPVQPQAMEASTSDDQQSDRTLPLFT